MAKFGFQRDQREAEESKILEKLNAESRLESKDEQRLDSKVTAPLRLEEDPRLGRRLHLGEIILDLYKKQSREEARNVMERPNDEPECIVIEEAAFFMTQPSLRFRKKLDPGSIPVAQQAKQAECK